MMAHEFAKVVRVAADVLCLRPDMDEAAAEAFLARNARHIQERMCERGWEAIDTLLDMEEA